VSDNENARPGDEVQGGRQSGWRAGFSVTDVDRIRRRWRLHQIGTRRRISAALDRRCGIAAPEPGAVQIDYAATGLTLGYPERRAAGRALLELERAA